MALNFDESTATGLAGLLGAAVSMRFIQGTWIERVTLAAGGAALSYYASPWLASKTGMPEGLTGFLVGLFGMALASKAWEVIQASPVAEFWRLALKRASKWLGV